MAEVNDVSGVMLAPGLRGTELSSGPSTDDPGPVRPMCLSLSNLQLISKTETAQAIEPNASDGLSYSYNDKAGVPGPTPDVRERKNRQSP